MREYCKRKLTKMLQLHSISIKLCHTVSEVMTLAKTILIIEDEADIQDILTAFLSDVGYIVLSAFDGANGISMFRSSSPDLVLLDVGLPGQDGREICKQVRKTASLPIIFVTADDDVASEIAGMLAGGDDYIAKPYHPALLLARIAAVLKRAQKPADDYAFTHNGVTLDIRTYKISHKDQQAELSKNECKLLHYLFQHPGEVVPRLELMEYLWDNAVFIDDNALSITVTRIRAKLEDIGVSGFIETKRGAGYRI